MDNLHLSSDSSYSHRKNTRIKKSFKRLDVKVKIAKPSYEEHYENDDYCVKDHTLPISFQALRHFEHIKRLEFEDENSNWRMRDKNNKMKTVSVALVLCLNIGVDPPDVMKIHPCSRVECWVDPTTLSAPKALEIIGSNLQKQYERWQPRARYKKSPDPTSDDIKKLCTSLRRNAKEERVLFHYNGHGVPMPTANGEIWVFNKNYTQYIPLSIYDLQIWMGAPSIYVYDCSHAGVIIKLFNQFARQHEDDQQKHTRTTESGGRVSDEQYISFRNCIQLAACSENEILPMNPQLPADLFTSCLTTPIKMALKWYTMQQGQGKMVLAPSINGDLIDKIPGQIADRRTMLGELNWIFTAITDTIAWNTLDRDLFQKLFRQDLLVASLFRNFLLAERILKHHDCTPVSSPVLPQCFRHSMWEAWDLAVDLALQQLPDILDKNIPYKQSPFFEEQLTAFQVWLNRASDKRTPPEQLPIVLQVLLSQVHRLRALELLGRFLDSGPWAVHLALGVGIFPYVLKLLQSAAGELKPVLVHIWAKILAVDSMCQVDLYKHNKYFISVLQDVTYPKETRTLAAFVMSSIVNNFKEGQKSALQDSLLSICLVQLNDDDSNFRQWVIICLGLLWQNFAEARWSGARDMAYDKLTDCLCDPVPEVRAASIFALGTFISSVTNRTEEQANNIDRFVSTNLLKVAGEDMSPLVRLELVGALQWMVILFESHFVSVFIPEFVEIKKNLRPGNNIALLPQMNTKDIVTSLIWDHNGSRHQTHSLERNFMRRGFSSNSFNNISLSASVSSPSHGSPNIPYGSMFLKLWQGICSLARDPYPKVSEAACLLLEHITNKAEIALITAKEATMIEKYCTSVSLPPSPNTRSSFLGDSPPQRENSNNSMICGSAGTRKDSMMGRNGAEITLPIQQAHIRRSSNNGSTSEETNNPIKPLVVTNFIPWCISHFARPTQKMFTDDGAPIDKHSEINRARISRFKRNEKIRKIAIDQQSRAMFIRIDTPIVNFKTQFTPYIIKMFPYESSIAVAYRDKVVVRDLSDLSSYDCNPNLNNSTSSRFSFDLTKISRVSTMEFINSHDKPMIMVGHDNGMIRIWQENNKCEGQKDYKLVSAWMGLPYLSTNSPSSRNISGSSTQGMISTWHQRSQHLIVGDHIVNGSCGPMRYLRIWDARTELKIGDLPTNAESSLRVLSSGPSEIIAAGYGNGSISLFDKRLPSSECKVRTFREHTAPILNICLRDRAESMISGCSYGKINLFDLRSHQGPSSWKVGSDVTAITVHSAADIIAFGSHSNIKIFGLDGRTHTSLKPYEGLLSSRLGQPSCLAFHPHKINLAAGYLDNTVYVYGSSGLTSKGG